MEKESGGSNNDGSDFDEEEVHDSEEEEAAAPRRKSSRSTAYRGGMKDPSNSIKDLLKPIDSPAGGGKKRRGSRAKRSSLEKGGDDSDNSESEEDDLYNSPKKKTKASRRSILKSPAKRHSKRRMSKRLEYPPESSEEEDSDSEEESGEEEDSEGEEEEEMKMNKAIACKSMTLKEWKVVCTKMNTSEITNGSRWLQEEPEEDVDETSKYEERFLVKWNDLSFLHCSWETEKDLVEFCDGAKGRLSTFFRKAEGGLLYEADERLDGVSVLFWGGRFDLLWSLCVHL